MKLRRTPLTLRALALYAVAGCCVLSLIIGAMQSAGQALGILPTSTPRPPTATPGPTNTTGPTSTPGPTDTPRPTLAPLPTWTSVPTRTPRPTEDPGPAQTIQAELQATNTARAEAAAAPCSVGQVKANNNSGVYHQPGQPDYAKTKSNVTCFDTADAAQAAGFRPADR